MEIFPRTGGFAFSRSPPPRIRALNPVLALDNPELGPLHATDRDIIARVLSGDRESFHDLVRRHESPLWATLRSHLRNLEDAREVFQETWLRAFERLASLRDPTRLRSWLLSIALNLARQRMRRAAPLSTEGGGEDGHPGLGELEGRAEDPGEAVEQREERDRLRAEIRGLPPRQREVMDLRVNHELNHGEIAALLGISEESSRANYYQALRRLRTRCATDVEDRRAARRMQGNWPPCAEGARRRAGGEEGEAACRGRCGGGSASPAGKKQRGRGSRSSLGGGYRPRGTDRDDGEQR